METLHLLKEEINQTLESLHDFAKWKLIATAGLAAAAMGFTSSASTPHYWLLILIPFVCAYIDLNCYQYLIRIAVIARCLRTEGQDTVLSGYEDLCEELRSKHRVFSLGEYAGVGVSTAISCVAPVAAVWNFSRRQERLTSAAFWILGISLIVALWFYYKSKLRAVELGLVNRPSP